MLKRQELVELQRFATQIRLETLKEIKNLGFGHIGGALSIVETLAVLYGKVMKINPLNPDWEERDWLVVSKGHAGPAVYAALALKGFFPLEDLMTLNQPRTKLPSHCDRNLTAGIDMTTGSLGQGISTAIGIALGHRLDRRESFVYLIVGDGEINEGQIWEGALFAPNHQLDNLILLVDNNKKQLDGYTKDINDLGVISEKFRSFGWDVDEVDGSNLGEIYQSIHRARKNKGKPSAIILDTIKGQGVKFVEETLANHHIKFSETEDELTQQAIEKLTNKLEKLQGVK
ncbi:MAG: transketolase [Halanaerobiales bacterium]|nr:transketolase [Halanaerobiales bacterium]